MADILKPESGNLHRVMDSIEQIKDTVKREREDHSQGVAELKAQNESLIEIVDGLEKRCNALDEALPAGEKVFRSEVAGPTTRDQRLRMLGEVITASRRRFAGYQVDEKFLRAQGEVTSTAGGVLVPTETYDGVMQLIREKSIIRGLSNVIPMSRDQMVVPTRASGPSVAWINEGGSAMTDQSVTFKSDANSLLTTKTLTVLDKVSRELDEDSLVALEPFLADVFAQAIGAEENRVAFRGDVTTDGDAFNGVATDATTVKAGSTVANNLTWANINEVKYTVDAFTNGADAAWIFHPTCFQVIAGLVDDQGRPLFLTKYSDGGIMDPNANAIQGSPGTLLGSPVYLSSQLPSATQADASLVGASNADKCQGLYGAFKTGFAFGDRRSLSVETNDSVYFDQHAKAVLASERIAMRVLLPDAFATFRHDVS
jgi:HK97 family phage major capsid protein